MNLNFIFLRIVCLFEMLNDGREKEKARERERRKEREGGKVRERGRKRDLSSNGSFFKCPE